MNTFPTFPATQVGLVGRLLYRIIAFLALGIRASVLGTTREATVRTRVWIVAFAARLLALARNFARLAARPLRGWQTQRAVRWRARGFGVVLPSACFPTLIKPTEALPADAGAPACTAASDASAQARRDCAPRTLPAMAQPDSGLCQRALPRRIPDCVSSPAWVGWWIASDGEHDHACGTRSKLRKRTRHGLVHGRRRWARPTPVANFRQAFATGMRALRPR